MTKFVSCVQCAKGVQVNHWHTTMIIRESGTCPQFLRRASQTLRIPQVWQPAAGVN